MAWRSPATPTFLADRRYVVTVQAGDISVVSPPSGVLAEKNILEIEDGEVTGILRAQMSSLTAPGQHVLSDEKRRELGRLMAHIEANFPFELGDVPRDQVLVDMEIKLMPNGELTVKQVRPFLISEPPSTAPVFRIDVSAGTEASGVFRKRSTNRGTREEFELKTLIRFLPGRHDLPGSLSTFTMNLIEEVLFGPSREVLAPTGPGTVRRFVFPAGEETLYRFEFEQDFATGSGQTIHITMKPLLFTVDPVAPLPGPLVLDEAISTNSFVPGAVPELVEDAGAVPVIAGELRVDGNRIHDLRFSSCDLEALPLWAIEAAAAHGNSLYVEWRYRLRKPEHEIGPAAQTYARFEFGDETREVFDYWNNVYSARRHNNAVE
jgi:hypothetical protein